MNPIHIRRLESLNPEDIEHLVAESTAEGFRHMRRLVDDYRSGANRFDQRGEALFAAFDQEKMVGIGGLNQCAAEGIGRVRRLYILQEYRKQGIGGMIMLRIMEEARKHFTRIELKTDRAAADQFYRALGFTHVEGGAGDSSHYLVLENLY